MAAEDRANRRVAGNQTGAAPSILKSTLKSTLAREENRGLWLLMAFALALGLVYNAVIMPGFGPDEPRHLRYVQLLWEERRFPFLLPGGQEYRGAHSLHPPLPYILMLPLFGLGSLFSEAAQYHLLRLFSLACSLAAIPLIFQTALAAAHGSKRSGSKRSSSGQAADKAAIESASWERSVALCATAICVLAPIFGMASGVVNNDAPSLLAVALFVWLLCVRFGVRMEGDISPRRALILGVVFGLGMMCKATVALCDGAALLAFLVARYGWKSSATWRSLAIVLGVAIVIAAPWYGRNFALYGKFSPIESGYSHPALPSPSNGPLVMAMHPNFPTLFGYANWGIFYSLWSQKDWFPLALRTPIYSLLALATALAAIAPLATRTRSRLARAESPDPDEDQRLARATRLALYSSLGLLWAACAGMALFVHWGWAEGGRYLLAALPALALFLSLRLHLLVPARALQVLAWALGLLLNTIAVYWLLSYLNPTFGPR